MKSKISIIIQARTSSTRLPDKMILPFYRELSVLEILFLRLKKAFIDIPIIVATTLNKNDDIIEKKATQYGLSCYRGDETDVLNRFLEAARLYSVDKIIRICADNPFLDIPSLELLVESFKINSSDYLAFSTSNQVPTIKTHYGFWAEAVSLEALEKVNNFTKENLYHEHVTNYIYTHPDKFNISLLKIPHEIESNHSIRLTLDTTEDFNIQKDLFEIVYEKNNNFKLFDVVNVLNQNPNYYTIMNEQIEKNSK